MKKFLLLFAFNFLLFTFNFPLSTALYAQIPPMAFNYSAVARDAQSQPIANKTIGIQISILKTSSTGQPVYTENHFVNTDQFGLFNLIVGGGTVVSGNMSAIDWGGDNFYLKVGMDANGGTNFLIMGTTQLLSVPYALYAKTSGSAGSGTGITIKSISGNGDTLYLSNGKVFTSGKSGTGITIKSISANGDTLYLSNGKVFTSGKGETGNLVLPTITTNPVTGITSNSATFSGNITNANGNQIMERGIVYSTSPNPTIYAQKIIIGSGIGVFDTISALSYGYEYLLNANTNYYVRAYAITENNIIAYGNEVSFKTLPVGQTGPGGGRVFFDKGNTTGGWRYLEAAANDQSTGIGWGCSGASISGTKTDVGSGEANTALITAGCNETNYAAKLCSDLILGGQNDWFLPSRDELYMMYLNLYKYNLGNFNIDKVYWSSSENDTYNAWYFYFDGGTAFNFNKYFTYYVRAVRAF